MATPCPCTTAGLIAAAAGTYVGGVPMTLAGTIATSDISTLPSGTCSFLINIDDSPGTIAYNASNSVPSNASNTTHNHILYQHIADNFPDVGGTASGNLLIAADTVVGGMSVGFGCPCGSLNGSYVFKKFQLKERYVIGSSIYSSVIAQGSWNDIVTYLQGEGMPSTLATASWVDIRAWIEDDNNLPNLEWKVNGAATLATNPVYRTGDNDVQLTFDNTGATCPTTPPNPCTSSGYSNYGCLGVNLSNESAPGASDGSVSVTVTGGFSPFTYSWTDPNGVVVGTTQTVTGLPGAIGQGIYYTVTVTDVKGCTTTCTANVRTTSVPINPCIQDGGVLDALQATCTKTDENYTGSADGTATSVVTWTPNVALGLWGAVTFTYTWYTGGAQVVTSTGGTPATGLTATGLTAGTYNFEVIASFLFNNEVQQRCIANCVVVVGVKTPPNPCITNPVTVAITNSIAPTINTTGSITIAPGSGTAPYSFVWTYPDGTTVNMQNITGPVSYTHLTLPTNREV